MYVQRLRRLVMTKTSDCIYVWMHKSVSMYNKEYNLYIV